MWHSVACKLEKPIICEDIPWHVEYVGQTFPNTNIPLKMGVPKSLYLLYSIYDCHTVTLQQLQWGQDQVGWHHKHDMPIIYEDVQWHIEYARQTYPYINIP
jgi:hypothetical protein